MKIEVSNDGTEWSTESFEASSALELKGVHALLLLLSLRIIPVETAGAGPIVILAPSMLVIPNPYILTSKTLDPNPTS